MEDQDHPKRVFFKWMAELKVASRKLHTFAGRRATDIWDCGSLHNICGISRNMYMEHRWIVYGISMERRRTQWSIYGILCNISEYLWNAMEYP